MASCSSRRRSASFSGGALQQRKKINARHRTFSVSSLGDGLVPQQLLRTQLCLVTDVDELIANRILSCRENDRAETAMRDWLNHPMLTSDDELAKIIMMEQCTKLSPRLEAGSVAYFRSWPMEARYFRQIIEELRLHGYENSIQDWIFFLRWIDQTTRITVRYVGSTSEPRNPFKRVQKNTERPQSLFGMFLYILHNRYPEIADLHKIFTIHGSFVSDFSKLSGRQNMLSQRFHNSVTDRTERCLIAFFGFRTLLNRQRGGKHGVITVDDEEERVFLRCKTNLWTEANGCYTKPPQNDYARTKVWSEEDKLKEASRETYISGVSAQAVAKSWLNGYALLALCGQEPPISSINDGNNILSGIRATSSLIRTNLFSFNQLFNWPQLAPKHKQRSRELFDSWLEAIQPLIVATLGQHVYAWVCQPSRRQTPPKSLLNEVGVPRLAQIPNSIYDTIIIPHLHPGSFARNPSISSQDRVFWYPWVATWVYMDTAIRLLSSHDTSYTSRQALCVELHIQAEAILKQAGYFESLQVAKEGFAVTTKTTISETMYCKKFALGTRSSATEGHALPSFNISSDRRAVLDQHLSCSALSDQDISQPIPESIEHGSKKRPRDMFEENERFVDPRTNLTSYNWGPSDKTLERWRKVYDFIRNVESFQFTPRLKNKVTQYTALFSVAASIHRCPGGLVAGLNPLEAAHPSEWKDDMRSFNDEFLKCVHSFQNAVIHSYIKNLPNFLLERNWTGSNSSSKLPKLSPHERNSAIAGNQPSFHMPASLFETKALAVHPLYRFKLALERCGKTEGLPSSIIRHQQAEQLFEHKVPKLCGWSSDKVAWVEFLQGLDEGVWIAASLETARGDEMTWPERDRFIETFGDRTGADESDTNEARGIKLQRASQRFMIQQMQWLGNITRGKVADSSYLNLNEAEGHQINVSQHGKVQLRFNLKNDSIITTDIKLGPLIAPLEKDDKRTIHFTDLGIDIRTATGLTIKVPINNSTCTLPLSAMKSHKNGIEFIRLWKAVRGEDQPGRCLSSLLKSSDEDADYPPELRVSSNGEKGATPPQKRLETIQEPGENDAMWLLKSYIDSHLPDGGDFWTGNKVDFPQGTDDVGRFIE
ncbi:hypothetical protein FPRO05_04701 [Fusarium proliferatum]|uniref:Uncharacterized protein n=1 Tax=Gibberella intermedia TaxID=948311 RepID=A0A365MSM1_GIBIN|nr:hypothetical protein FPRO05_04701 [Fusarium proliferatum]